MLSQKKIYQAWEKRFNYPKTSLENQAEKTFAKVRRISSISATIVEKMVKDHKLLLVGDDATIGMQQEMLIQNILRPLKNKRTLLITNRNDPKVFSIMKKMGIVIKKIPRTNVSQETSQMMSQAERSLNRYDHILVWTGHLRLSSKNFQLKFKNRNALFVYLQSNQLHWKFPNQNAWKKIDTNQIAWMDSSPLISIDHYRSTEENGFILIKPQMLQPIFNQMMREISKILRQKNIDKPKKILHVFSDQNIKKIDSIKPKLLKKFILDRVMKGESAVMPREKLVLLSTLNLSHISEEAAHYLRTAQNKVSEYGEMMSLIEEALAFFASLLLFPNRQIPATTKSHDTWDKIHDGGYNLGVKLLNIWNSSSKNKSMIRKLWKLHPKNEFEAQMMFTVMRDMK
jgi:hypothetical protein